MSVLEEFRILTSDLEERRNDPPAVVSRTYQQSFDPVRIKAAITKQGALLKKKDAALDAHVADAKADYLTKRAGLKRAIKQVHEAYKDAQKKAREEFKGASPAALKKALEGLKRAHLTLQHAALANLEALDVEWEHQKDLLSLERRHNKRLAEMNIRLQKYASRLSKGSNPLVAHFMTKAEPYITGALIGLGIAGVGAAAGIGVGYALSKAVGAGLGAVARNAFAAKTAMGVSATTTAQGAAIGSVGSTVVTASRDADALLMEDYCIMRNSLSEMRYGHEGGLLRDWWFRVDKYLGTMERMLKQGLIRRLRPFGVRTVVVDADASGGISGHLGRPHLPVYVTISWAPDLEPRYVEDPNFRHAIRAFMEEVLRTAQEPGTPDVLMLSMQELMRNGLTMILPMALPQNSELYKAQRHYGGHRQSQMPQER